MKKRAIVVAALLLFACDPVVRRIVTLTFDESGENVTISATTQVDHAEKGTPEFAEAQEAREALAAERDEWSVRFAQAAPNADRVILERAGGELTSVERQATVTPEKLQKFLFDTPITVTTTRGDGWMELTMYPGSSTRASATQRRVAQRILTAYSERAAVYFHAVRSMYLYLDEKPQRAEALFAYILSTDDDARPLLSDEEHGLSEAIRDAGTDLMNANEIEPGTNADQLFDLVYNPFPAQFRVVIRGAALAVEGFTREESDTFTVKLPTLAEAVGRLEGRWITPDVMATALNRQEKTKISEVASQMAEKPRHAEAVVTPSEIAAALVAQMRPAPRYRLRWVTKRSAPAS